MRIPSRRPLEGSANGTPAHLALIFGAVVIAVTIVVVTRSTNGLAVLVEVIAALAAVCGAKRGRRQ